MSVKPTKPVEIFYSYSHKDEELRNELEKHLSILKRQDVITGWHDRKIGAGKEWEGEIDTHLNTAHVILLLISADFLASDYCYDVEMKRAMERHEAGEARVIPVILRPCDWKGAPFGKLQALPTDAKPVTRWPDRDEAFLDVAKGIRAAVEELVGPSAGLPSLRPASEPVRPVVLERRQPFEPEMRLIPAGEFLMGSDPRIDKDAQGNEQPQHTLYLPNYYLAKTPITNAQYLDFVQDTGHERPKHWEGGDPPSGKEDHPVVYVSWYDALTYCNWLAEVTGKPYRLPNEAEWEKGARGSDGRIYPWGNQWDAKRCNSEEGGKGNTTPVGAYPKGASPYVLLDMAGNVWEWTRSLWGESEKKPNFAYPYKSEDGRENLKAGKSIRRVMRGGEFRDRDSGVRCARRHGDEPNLRSKNLGFRVMMALSSPVEPAAGPRAVQVSVTGSGAAAVGERAVAAGAGGVAVGGDVHGGIHVGGKEKGK